MITRLLASALLVAGLSQVALAQTSTQESQPSNPLSNQPSTSAQSTQTPQNVPQSLRQQLTSAGFTDVNIVPSSVLITAKDRNGRPVMMRITPNSMFFLTEVPVANSSTTGAGTGSSDPGLGNSSPGMGNSSPGMGNSSPGMGNPSNFGQSK